jgi:hypothetical protein
MIAPSAERGSRKQKPVSEALAIQSSGRVPGQHLGADQMQHRRIRQLGGRPATALGTTPGQGLQPQAIATEGLNHPGVLSPLEQAYQPVTAAVEAAAQAPTGAAGSRSVPSMAAWAVFSSSASSASAINRTGLPCIMASQVDAVVGGWRCRHQVSWRWSWIAEVSSPVNTASATVCGKSAGNWA